MLFGNTVNIYHILSQSSFQSSIYFCLLNSVQYLYFLVLFLKSQEKKNLNQMSNDTITNTHSEVRAMPAVVKCGWARECWQPRCTLPSSGRWPASDKRSERDDNADWHMRIPPADDTCRLTTNNNNNINNGTRVERARAASCYCYFQLLSSPSSLLKHILQPYARTFAPDRDTTG